MQVDSTWSPVETLVNGSNQRRIVNKLPDSSVSQTPRLQWKLYQTTLHFATYMMERSSGTTKATPSHNAVLIRSASAHQNQQQVHQVGLSVNSRIKHSLDMQFTLKNYSCFGQFFSALHEYQVVPHAMW